MQLTALLLLGHLQRQASLVVPNHDMYLVSMRKVAGRIGKGAYGGVWQATVLEGNREVVVKVVFPDPDLDPEDAAKSHPSEEKLSSFRREIEVMRFVLRERELARGWSCVSIPGCMSAGLVTSDTLHPVFWASTQISRQFWGSRLILACWCWRRP